MPSEHVKFTGVCYWDHLLKVVNVTRTPMYAPYNMLQYREKQQRVNLLPWGTKLWRTLLCDLFLQTAQKTWRPQRHSQLKCEHLIILRKLSVAVLRFFLDYFHIHIHTPVKQQNILRVCQVENPWAHSLTSGSLSGFLLSGENCSPCMYSSLHQQDLSCFNQFEWA